MDGGAAVGGGVGPDVAAHVEDDAVDEGKAEAGVVAVAAALDAFFGEEGVEDVGEIVGFDADAGVGELEHDLIALGLGADGDAAFAAGGGVGAFVDGVFGVAEEVLEGLSEAEAGDGGDAVGLKVEFEGDAFLVEGGFDGVGEAEEFFGEVAEVAGGFAFAAGFTGAGEEALGDVAHAGGGFGGHAEGFEHGGGVFGGECEFDHGAHAAGDVVEVVGDAGGEGADGGHVAGAGEVLFEFFAVGDVAHPGGDADEGALIVDDATEGDADVEGIFSALGDDGHFVEVDGALLDGALEGAAGDGAVFIGDESFEGASDDFGFRAAEHADGGEVPGADAAGGVEGDDGDSGVEDCGLIEVGGEGGVGW